MYLITSPDSIQDLAFLYARYQGALLALFMSVVLDVGTNLREVAGRS